MGKGTVNSANFPQLSPGVLDPAANASRSHKNEPACQELRCRLLRLGKSEAHARKNPPSLLRSHTEEIG